MKEAGLFLMSEVPLYVARGGAKWREAGLCGVALGPLARDLVEFGAVRLPKHGGLNHLMKAWAVSQFRPGPTPELPQ